MQARTQMELKANDLELWTMDDAEAWKEASGGTAPDVWMEDDPLLDNDLWMEGDNCDSLSIEGLGRLGIHFA